MKNIASSHLVMRCSFVRRESVLYHFLQTHVDQNTAPFAAIALFAVIVGISLWITPHVAKWIDKRSGEHAGFFDDMMEQPPECEKEEE